MRNLSEIVTDSDPWDCDRSYWGSNGKHQEISDRLDKVLGDESIWAKASRIYRDLFNNGGCNLYLEWYRSYVEDVHSWLVEHSYKELAGDFKGTIYKFAFLEDYEDECDECGGTGEDCSGWSEDEDEWCQTCGGDGFERVERPFYISDDEGFFGSFAGYDRTIENVIDAMAVMFEDYGKTADIN